MILDVPSVDLIRQQYRSLQSGFVFLENAGGSQVPDCVADAIREFMVDCYVQTGAPYEASIRCANAIQQAHDWMNVWVNSGEKGTVALGASATQWVHTVANAFAATVQPGDEFIICDTNHEANATAWERLSRLGAVIKYWRVDPDTLQCSLDSLRSLLTDRTRLVSFPQVSNILGEVVDVAAITRLCHDAGARVFVDGVAYAPHGVIDVEAWDVDWYLFSNYKVYGPHMATLYGKFDAFAELPGPNHYFIGEHEVPRKWELGAINYEGCAGLVALQHYVKLLSGQPTADRNSVVAACHQMQAMEAPLTERLLEFLNSKATVKLYHPGEETVGTVSFTSSRVLSQDVPPLLAKGGIGIRAGYMYSIRLAEALGLDLQQGVIRVSLLHYNSAEDIDRCIAALDRLI